MLQHDVGDLRRQRKVDKFLCQSGREFLGQQQERARYGEISVADVLCCGGHTVNRKQLYGSTRIHRVLRCANGYVRYAVRVFDEGLDALEIVACHYLSLDIRVLDIEVMCKE